MKPASPLRIAHTVRSIESEAAGTTYVAKKLSEEISALGHSVSLLSLGQAPSTSSGHGYHDLRFERIAALGKLGASRAMRHAIFASEADVFHTHGLWTMPNIYPASAAHRRARPFVLSPHGMLAKEALQFSPLKKRVFWALLQGRAVRQAACLHATAEQEYEDIRALGLMQPVAIIPNGIDLPALPASSQPASPVSPFILALGRIHPIKGLDRLIRAWALVSPAFPQWRLRIVGPSELGHVEELKRLTRGLSLQSVAFSGPVFGAEKTALLAEAQLFALSTLHDNFAMTVAESLAAGTPAIATKGAPWQGLEQEHCGRWIDHGAEAMAAALKEIMSLSPKERRAMGARGRAWMERDFGWVAIAGQMLELYHWLLAGGAPPASVRSERVDFTPGLSMP